jgi:branched-chain amino acid transport system ATP-binding protein
VVSARVDELLSLFGLEVYRDVFVADLSTGTRRIVELACAVGHQPSLLLLDEPGAGVAQREVEALGGLLLRIRDELGCGIVLIEHDVPLVAAVADEMVALEAGSVISRGAPAQVLSDPLVVASYLGQDRTVVDRSDTSRSAPVSSTTTSASTTTTTADTSTPPGTSISTTQEQQ